MDSLTILFLAAIPIFLFVILQSRKSPKKLSPPPGPKGLPLVGNLLQLDASAPHRHLWQLSQKYGPLMSFRLGYVSTVVVSSAKMAKEIMRTHDIVFSNRTNFLGQRKLAYDGYDLAFAPYDASWRELRKICVVHLFNSIRVQTFRPIREDEVSRMIAKVSRFADESKPVNLSDVMLFLTSTIVCRAAFGTRYEEDGAQRCRFQSLLEESQALFAGFYVSDHFPFLSFVDRLTGMVDRLEKNFKEFDAFYEEIIQEHLDPNRPKPEQEDILDVLLQIQKDRSFKLQLTLEHIKGVLVVSSLASAA